MKDCKVFSAAQGERGNFKAYLCVVALVSLSTANPKYQTERGPIFGRDWLGLHRSQGQKKTVETKTTHGATYNSEVDAPITLSTSLIFQNIVIVSFPDFGRKK